MGKPVFYGLHYNNVCISSLAVYDIVDNHDVLIKNQFTKNNTIMTCT